MHNIFNATTCMLNRESGAERKNKMIIKVIIIIIIIM